MEFPGKACSRVLALLVTTVLAAAPAVPAWASEVHRFDIPEEDAAAAIHDFGSQAHVQILVAGEAVKDKKLHAVSGDFSTEVALNRLLAGSGLSHKYVGDSSIALLPVSLATEGADQTAPASTLPPNAPDNRSSLQVAQVAQVAQVDQTSAGPQVVEKKRQEANEAKEAIDEVVVTGSRLPQGGKDSVHDVRTYTSQQISLSGQTTVADFLNTLPNVSLAATNESAFQTFGGMTTVNLHGLPSGTTLVLINGRRVETSGATSFYGNDFFDLNNIPLAAVDRIEVVPDGSSAIYGSDAIAGVVNVILKRDVDGISLDVKSGKADELNDTIASLVIGKVWGKGGVSLAATYQARGNLTTDDRAITSSNDYTAFGGPNNNFPDCRLGNVYSTTGQPLPGAPPGSNATVAAVNGSAGTGKPTLGDFAYGTLNECSLTANFSLIPATHRVGVFAEGHYELGNAVEVFAELMYSHQLPVQNSSYQSLFGLPGFQSYTVPASNPYNPFGTTVGVSQAITSIGIPALTDTEFFRPLVGVRGQLTNGWDWELSAWEAADWTDITLKNSITNAAGIQDALNSADPASALNPFVAGPLGPQAQLQSFFSDGQVKFSGRDESATGFVRGAVAELPAGPLSVVVGGEYDGGRLTANYVNYPGRPPEQTSYSRTSYAAFSELRIPIIPGATSNGPAAMSLSLAGRYDHYSDFGGTTNPQAGLEWRPLSSLLLRATYARAFKAPPLADLSAATLVVPNVGVVDPKTGQIVLVNEIKGGNPSLQAITGKSHTFGAVWTSLAVPDLRLSVTNWDIQENQAIQSVLPQVIVDNEADFPGRVIRDPSGQITEIIDTSVNFGTIEVAGIDYSATYQFASKWGGWTPSLNVTQTYRYQAALVPGAVAVNGLSEAQDTNNWAPRWKGIAALGWTLGPLSLHVDARYVGKYQDYDTTRIIGNFWLTDLNMRLERAGWFGRGGSAAPKDLYLEVGAVNAFNRLPQYSSYGGNFVGYDATQADIRGRFLYVSLGVKL